MDKSNQKKYIIVWVVVFVVLVCFWVFYYFYSANQNTGNQAIPKTSTNKKQVQKDLSYYKDVFSGTFFNYENTISKIKKNWTFDFELTLAAEWDASEVFSGIVDSDDLNIWSFQNITLKTYGDYDIQDPKKASFKIYLKIFLNKEAVGLWDFDINLDVVSSGDVQYVLNNLDENFLNFVLDNSDMSKDLLKEFQKNKLKKIETQIPAEILPQFVSVLESLNPEALPLYKDTKEQEKQIQDSFIQKEAIKVITGQSLDDNVDKIQITFDGSNFVDFMNEVSKIVNTWNNVVNFDSERELFQNMFSFNWVMNIKNKTIQDSTFVLEFMIWWVNKSTNKKQWQVISNTINFKSPNPEIFDITLKDSFGRYAEILNQENINLLTGQQSLSPDKLNITFRWLIK